MTVLFLFCGIGNDRIFFYHMCRIGYYFFFRFVVKMNMDRYLAVFECGPVSAKRFCCRPAFRLALYIEARIMAWADKHLSLFLILYIASLMGTFDIDGSKIVFAGTDNKQILIELFDHEVVGSADRL